MGPDVLLRHRCPLLPPPPPFARPTPVPEQRCWWCCRTFWDRSLWRLHFWWSVKIKSFPQFGAGGGMSGLPITALPCDATRPRVRACRSSHMDRAPRDCHCWRRPRARVNNAPCQGNGRRWFRHLQCFCGWSRTEGGYCSSGGSSHICGPSVQPKGSLASRINDCTGVLSPGPHAEGFVMQRRCCGLHPG